MIVELTQASRRGRAVVGGKAANLSDLLGAGFPVPAGMVITADDPDRAGLDDRLAVIAARLGGERFAVRSSAAAEDLPNASYAGLYESYLDVPAGGLGAAVRACFASAQTERVAAYQRARGVTRGPMAVLVQVMVESAAAGVAFTAHPVSGDRTQTVVTAVRGHAEALVSGHAAGEEWTVTADSAAATRPGPALTPAQAVAVATLAGRIAERYDRPQDVEWAMDQDGRLWVVQARPMTALPPRAVTWNVPGPGLWMRNFRLGEWLPEAVTPLFATWLLPVIEEGYLDGMQATIGVRVPFRYALVNGWYYNAAPVPSPALLGRVLRQGGRRAVTVLFNALIRVGRNPAAADRAVLGGLERQWRTEQLPRYRRLVEAAENLVATAGPRGLAAMVDELGREAGVALWHLAVVGGSAWKMEACLTRFTRRHLAEVLPDADGGAQLLLRGLAGAEPEPYRHAVHSVDWFHPVAAELPAVARQPAAADRYPSLATRRARAERACADALAGRPLLLARFRDLLRVTQHYAAVREEQARTFTLAWPVLRACAHRLGRPLAGEDVFFCTRAEVAAARPADRLMLDHRRATWQQQRRLAAPLTLGRPPRLVGDVIDRTVRRARGAARTAGGDVIVGHPASAGRATGPACIITDPHDFSRFTRGDVLVATATAPAWTPLFALAAAVITDGGTLAAHASLIAREYGIPAVVGTGNATSRLQPGQIVTVDGAAGTVTPQTTSV